MKANSAVRAVRLLAAPLAALGMIAAQPATAQTVTGLFNTGVDAFGNPLADNAADPHWFFVSGLTANPSGGTNAIVSCTNGAWSSPGTGAKWVAPNTGGCGSMPNAPFTFFLRFTLAGFNPSTLSLSGNWSSDNSGFGVFLNGSSIAGPTGSTAFTTLHPFSVGPGSGLFVNGVNTLAVQFQNEGGPGAVLVRDLAIRGQAEPPVGGVVPEPASMALLGTGLAGLMGAARRRRERDRA